MAPHTFAKVMPHVFASEGGYVDHPRDPGGATRYGITHHTLASWRGASVTKADVRALSKVEASEIYRVRYWNAINGDALPAGLDYAVFDFAINSGPQRAAECLQRVVNVPDDGKIGPVTLTAVRARDPASMADDLCDARLAFMKGLSTWGTFGRGWSARVQSVRERAFELAEGQPTPPAERPSTGRKTGWSVGLGAGLAAAVALWFSENGPLIIFMVGVVAAGGLALWRRDAIKAWWKERKG